MKKSIFFAFVLMSSLLFVACEKEDNPTANNSTLTSNVVKDLVADTIVGLSNGQPVGVGKYTFYSLENNTVVPSTDSNSNKWDIAFRGTSILTNAGTSGPGAGGAFVYTGTYDELKTVSPDSVFKKTVLPHHTPFPQGATEDGMCMIP